jgi:hypothetical protein
MSDDFQMTGAERKLSRQIMAELNAASCHLALMLNACLLQWQWGLRGGKPGALDEYPGFPEGAFSKFQAKKIGEQLITIDRYNYPLLEAWGIDGKKNMRDGMHYSVNQKVGIINATLQKHGPKERVYLEDLPILTAVLARAFRDLQELERHYDRNWKLLCQTLETLTKRVTTPSHLAYAEAIYAVVKPWLLGTAALCDWEEEK